jgi:stage II sporulation protein D
MSRLNRLSLLCLLACLLASAPASAASRLTIRGAGFGHGVGMSQYGAYGFAKQGTGYAEILAHYYQGTALGMTAHDHTVRVLLQATPGSVTFSGAAQAGKRKLNPGKTYRATRRGTTQVDLRGPSGARVATFTAPLQVAAADGALVLKGRAINGRTDGAYRGVLELRPGAFGLSAINAVRLDDYVRGVVAAESPASWPLEALKAQAVAARSYAITNSKGGAGFEHYPDTRSQVYGGVAAETASTDRAVAETAGQVVTYQGRPVVTYFFSTSGGRTENVENSLGGTPQPWLRSVEDPYDDASPRHRWKPIRMGLSDAGRRLGGLVKGSFRGVRVIRRGKSPRIVAADVIGSGGRTRVSGATLRARFGLYDTWAYFTSIASRKAPPPKEAPADQPPQRAAGDGTGGATPSARMTRFPTIASIAGEVVPGRDGRRVTVQVRRDGAWRTLLSTRLHGGAYRAAITQPGVYRAVFGGEAGPSVRIRG